jgi:hypothetical protein
MKSNVMSVDAIAMGMLALADIALLAYLRKRRRRAMQEDHMMLCLEFAVRTESRGPRRPWLVRARRPQVTSAGS